MEAFFLLTFVCCFLHTVTMHTPFVSIPCIDALNSISSESSETILHENALEGFFMERQRGIGDGLLQPVIKFVIGGGPMRSVINFSNR